MIRQRIPDVRSRIRKGLEDARTKFIEASRSKSLSADQDF